VQRPSGEEASELVECGNWRNTPAAIGAVQFGIAAAIVVVATAVTVVTAQRAAVTAPATAPGPEQVELGLSLLVVLGCASGLCLREGLIDLEAAAPQRVRGALTGAFYAVTYIGFGLPLPLTTVGSADSAMILAVMAVLASATAVSRVVRLRRDSHRQN